MRYCHECEADVGPKATECGECGANLIGSTANSQASSIAGNSGPLASLRALFDRGGDAKSSTEAKTDGGDKNSDDDADSGFVASIKNRF